MLAIDRYTFKLIESYFYNYQELKKAVKEHELDIIHSTPYNDGQPRGTDITDTTSQKALKLDTEESKCVKVVEKTIRYYANKKPVLVKLIGLRYIRRKKEFDVMEYIGIEKVTYVRWRDEVIVYAAIQAIQEGLIKI